MLFQNYEIQIDLFYQLHQLSVLNNWYSAAIPLLRIGISSNHNESPYAIVISQPLQ